MIPKIGVQLTVVVAGDLENEGDIDKQINWNNLQAQVKAAQAKAPDLVMMFVYAHPQKLDIVKTTLYPVLGESKFLIATEQGIDKTINKFLTTIGR